MNLCILLRVLHCEIVNKLIGSMSMREGLHLFRTFCPWPYIYGSSWPRTPTYGGPRSLIWREQSIHILRELAMTITIPPCTFACIQLSDKISPLKLANIRFVFSFHYFKCTAEQHARASLNQCLTCFVVLYKKIFIRILSVCIRQNIGYRIYALFVIVEYS